MKKDAGGMCLSGDIHELIQQQWDVVDRATEFYKLAIPIIKDGIICRFGNTVQSYRHPKGWQEIIRTTKDNSEILVVVHTFEGDNFRKMELPLPAPGHYEITDVFSDNNMDVELETNRISFWVENPFSAVAILLRKG